MAHVSSSSEGYYVMNDTFTGKWADDKIAGPFQTVSEADDALKAHVTPKPQPMDYPEFTGAASVIVASTIRKLRNVVAHGFLDGYDLEDVLSSISDMEALLNKAPEHIRSCIRL